MPLMDINDPRIIKFLNENYEKTTRLRMKWNELHREKLSKAATLQHEEKGYTELDVMKGAMEAGMLAASRDNITGARNRRLKPIADRRIVQGISSMSKGHSIIDVGLGDPQIDPKLTRPDTDLSIDPIMRPIHPKQKAILYKGRPYFGREVYLKKRCAAAPEDKYYFAESAGWSYGWRLKDSYFGKQKSQHGCVYQLDRAKSRSGPHPDPSHYKDPAYKGGKCLID